MASTGEKSFALPDLPRLMHAPPCAHQQQSWCRQAVLDLDRRRPWLCRYRNHRTEYGMARRSGHDHADFAFRRPVNRRK